MKGENDTRKTKYRGKEYIGNTGIEEQQNNRRQGYEVTEESGRVSEERE